MNDEDEEVFIYLQTKKNKKYIYLFTGDVLPISRLFLLWTRRSLSRAKGVKENNSKRKRLRRSNNTGVVKESLL